MTDIKARLQKIWPSVPDDLPWLPDDITEKITEALIPLGYVRPEKPNGDGDEYGPDTPFRQLNDEALSNLDKWVPSLGLYNCRRD